MIPASRAGHQAPAELPGRQCEVEASSLPLARTAVNGALAGACRRERMRPTAPMQAA